MKSSFNLCIKRLFAFFIDSIILGAVFFIFRIPHVISFSIAWFYFATFESSRIQATPGKRCLGISVYALDDTRATFTQTSFRFFGKYLSAFVFYLSYLFIFFTKKQQSLHDMVSGCVIKKSRF